MLKLWSQCFQNDGKNERKFLPGDSLCSSNNVRSSTSSCSCQPRGFVGLAMKGKYILWISEYLYHILYQNKLIISWQNAIYFFEGRLYIHILHTHVCVWGPSHFLKDQDEPRQGWSAGGFWTHLWSAPWSGQQCLCLKKTDSVFLNQFHDKFYQWGQHQDKCAKIHATQGKNTK